jgi:TolB-like protein
LQSLVLRCLEKQPEKRFPNCAELVKELRRCRAGHVSETSAVSTKAKPSIAVLPFTNMSPDPENEYFSDGLSEELLNVLAKNPGLRVTGRTSSFAFKGKHEDLREIGQKLGVETLLEGSVRKAGNRVRITTQLVKVSDGFHLWSETYDRVLDDIFAVQDDIAKSVATAMNVTLLGKATLKTHINAESFNLLMQANHFLSLMTRESLEKAKVLYESVLAIGSDDARAWAGLSRTLIAQAGYGFTDNEQGSLSAKAAGLRAVAIDDSLPDAHLVMGVISMRYDLDWKRAGESYRRAYALAPSDGRVVGGLSVFESYFGDMSRARQLAAESIKLDPLNASTFMAAARVYWVAGDLKTARQYFRTALELSPGFPSAHASISGTLAQEGRLEEALAEANKEPPSGYRSTALASTYHFLGKNQESDEALKSLVAEGEQWGFQIAVVHATRGEADLAFQWLERSHELHDSGIATTKVQPLLANLHSDPRWPQFLKKIGLAE